jgi:glyoxylase-like metal-dependent hydrolase (beta-lactamase superfamily II)
LWNPKTTGATELKVWEVYALKFADWSARTRAQSFVGDVDHVTPHPMAFYTWVLRHGNDTILVDTGYPASEAELRDRPIRRDPASLLSVLGLAPEEIRTVVLTHLHYDHAGALDAYPEAFMHLQAAEMAYATGPCMCHPTLRHHYTAEHICNAVRGLHGGRMALHDGDVEIADGVSLHRIGGHSRGLQAVRVRTTEGWLCLASDSAHYYENFLKRRVFPIVVDVEDMLAGFSRIEALASSRVLVVPGHDPLVADIFPALSDPSVVRLDRGPIPELASAKVTW